MEKNGKGRNELDFRIVDMEQDPRREQFKCFWQGGRHPHRSAYEALDRELEPITSGRRP